MGMRVVFISDFVNKNIVQAWYATACGILAKGVASIGVRQVELLLGSPEILYSESFSENVHVT